MATSEELRERFRELRTSLEALPEATEPPKTTLRILGSQRSEDNWNTLLAYFLDPSEPHGFGEEFLKAFLDKANQDTHADIEYFHRDIEGVEVDTEVTSPNDNIPDVVVRSPGKWFVCIECKVDSSEGHRQTQRYLEDEYIGREEKSNYPEDGRHYIFLSKEGASDARADGFHDLYWRHVVEEFDRELRRSHGRFPEKSVAQLKDFLSTIITVTNMEDDDFIEIQKEKVQLLDEHRDDIDEVIEAAENLRQRSIEEWPQMFLNQLDDELWTDEWHYWYEDYREWGCLFRDGWYLDDENLEPTIDHEATHGSTGFRLHFNHMIRRKDSFRRGKLTYRLRSPTRVDMRDEFNRLYNSSRWQEELQPIFDDVGIEDIGNKKNYLRKTYDVDQSGLPESYFETLAVAFEEFLPVAEMIDDIVEEAKENVKESG